MYVSSSYGGEYPGEGYMAVELIFVSARTNKRHHHHEDADASEDKVHILCVLAWLTELITSGQARRTAIRSMGGSHVKGRHQDK